MSDSTAAAPSHKLFLPDSQARILDARGIDRDAWQRFAQELTRCTSSTELLDHVIPSLRALLRNSGLDPSLPERFARQLFDLSGISSFGSACWWDKQTGLDASSRHRFAWVEQRLGQVIAYLDPDHPERLGPCNPAAADTSSKASSRAKAPARSPRPAPNRRGRPARADAIPKVNAPHVARALKAAGLTTAKQRSIAFKTLTLLRSQYIATKQGKVINRRSIATATGTSLRLVHDVLRRMVDAQLVTEPLRIPGRGNAAPSIVSLGLTFLDPMAKPPERQSEVQSEVQNTPAETTPAAPERGAERGAKVCTSLPHLKPSEGQGSQPVPAAPLRNPLKRVPYGAPSREAPLPSGCASHGEPIAAAQIPPSGASISVNGQLGTVISLDWNEDPSLDRLVIRLDDLSVVRVSPSAVVAS